MEVSIKVMIVDDEPIARDILQSYLQKVPGLELVATCSNALEAFGMLSRQPVDLMLLDINMPEVTGMDLLRSLKNPPRVIFTTAYSEYAIESYTLNAVDYLLKPIAFDRFLAAVNKILQAREPAASARPVATVADTPFFVKSGSKLVRISRDELWMAEGLKDYVKLHTLKNSIVVHGTMKSLEEQLLPHGNFVRVHKSFIINLNFVTEVNGNMVKLNGQEIMIGNTYRDEVQQLFERLKML